MQREMSQIFYWCCLEFGVNRAISPLGNIASKSFHSAEESDCLTEYEEDGMDTVREEEGEEEEEEADDPEDHSPGEWGQNGVFQTVSTHRTEQKTWPQLKTRFYSCFSNWLHLSNNTMQVPLFLFQFILNPSVAANV